MKKVKKKNLRNIDKIIVASVAVILIAITAIATRFALGAVDANISATVSPSTLNTQQLAVVTVMAHTGSQTVNVARARVTYDATKWQFVSADYTGVPFVDRTPEPPAHQGTGYYEVTGYRISAPFPSGDFLLGKVTLKAIGTANSTAINVDKSNSELYDSVNASKILGSVTGTVATINAPTTNPNPSPTPTPTPTPPSSTTSGRTSTSNTGSRSTGTQGTNTSGDPATPTETTDPTSIAENTENEAVPSSNKELAQQAVKGRQSNLSRYRTPILVAGLGLLLAAGATYGVMMYLHNRNHAMGTVATASSNGLSGAVIGSGLYGPQAGSTETNKPVSSDPNDPTKN
jgi:hypothetical protein